MIGISIWDTDMIGISDINEIDMGIDMEYGISIWDTYINMVIHHIDMVILDIDMGYELMT
jgi:hypothetical protein